MKKSPPVLHTTSYIYYIKVAVNVISAYAHWAYYLVHVTPENTFLLVIVTYLLLAEWQNISGLFYGKIVTLHQFYFHSIWSSIIWIFYGLFIINTWGTDSPVAVNVLVNIIFFTTLCFAKTYYVGNIKQHLQYPF